MKRYLADEQSTAEFARQVWRALPDDVSGWVLLLRGELGAGKSTFARALIVAAGHTGAVPSPTYTLVEPYNVSEGNIYHIDLYRVSDEEELQYLGWDDLDDGIRLVEWPERAPGLLLQADLELHLSYEGDGRLAGFTGMSRRGKAVVDAVANSDLGP